MPAPLVEIIAHRGSSFLAPENTLAACRLAWEEGADAVELDVHLSRDGHLVVIHDEDTKRTAGVSGLIRNLSLAQLRECEVGGWKGKKFAGESIPTLDEFLTIGPSERRFFIEVKCGADAVPELAACLERSELGSHQVVIISFHRDVVTEVKRVIPQFPSVWLVGADRDPMTGAAPTLSDIITEAKVIGADGLDLSAAWPIDSEFVREVRAAGLRIWVWTVDDAALARRLAEAGVDGITTNRPGWLRERLS